MRPKNRDGDEGSGRDPGPRGVNEAPPTVWTHDGSYELLGTPFRIRCSDRGAARHIDRLLAPFRRPQAANAPPENLFTITVQGRSAPPYLLSRADTPFYVADLPGVMTTLVAELNRAAIDGFEGLALHAGVVAKEGRALALPASSGGGKSTLTAALLGEGFDYVSDEALCLKLDTGQVVPYPKPLVLTPWSRRALGIKDEEVALVTNDEVPFSPPELGARVASQELELTDVVIPVRGERSARLTELSRPDVAAALIRYSFNHYKHPKEAFELAVGLARRCRGYRLGYEDPQAAAALIRETLSGSR